ncbi:MAG: hypothetical protein EBY29_07780 [Planctomycetes bacterium]|nr:hypothetical protein [Planctomycetota bacterium]
MLNLNLINSTAFSLLCCFANSLRASESGLQDPIEIVKTVVATNCIRCHAGQGPGLPFLPMAILHAMDPPWSPLLNLD